MTIIKALLLLLHFTIVPIAVGRLITYKAKTNWKADYIVGFFGNLAIFYLLFSIVEWYQNWNTFRDPVVGAFSKLVKVYLILVAVVVILWIVVDRKVIFTVIKKQFPTNLIYKVLENKYAVVYLVAFVVLFVTQLYFGFAYEINEWSYDDYDYVVTSKDAITSDTISYVNFIDGTMPVVSPKRAVASWGTYVAMVAKTTGYEVTTVYHTFLPVFLLAIAYLNFSYIAGFLFKKFEDRMIFLNILSVTYIFGLYSHYSASFRLLGALWQGKAILSIIAVPFFAMYLVDVYSRDIKTAYVLPIALVSLGASSLTSQSLLFIPVVAVGTWIVMCVYHKCIYGVRYLIASLFGPIYVGIYYILVWMLYNDMQNYDIENKYFKNRSLYWYK